MNDDLSPALKALAAGGTQQLGVTWTTSFNANFRLNSLKVVANLKSRSA